MASFSELISVEPINSHSYRVRLLADWSIGNVPHGGAVASILQAVARKHFDSTLKAQNQPDCIIFHADFLRRTSAGPATVAVRDLKLGRQTSTVQMTLAQDGREEIVATVTHSAMAAETGPSFPTAWQLTPRPPRRADLSQLAARGTDGLWRRWISPRPDIRHAAEKVDIFLQMGEPTDRAVLDQWCRFRGPGERFTNLSLGFLSDMFPQITETYVDDVDALAAAGTTAEQLVSNWYPTLVLNLDVKKALPDQGVEWLFLRLHAKVIKSGRLDMEVIIMDEAGDIVALSHHVTMILNVSRNMAKRSSKQRPDQSKL